MLQITQHDGRYALDVAMCRGAEARSITCLISTGCPVTVLDYGCQLVFNRNYNQLVELDSFPDVKFYQVIMDTVALGDIVLHNVETYVATSDRVTSPILGMNVLNQLDISIVGNIKQMRIRKAVGANSDRIHYVVSQYLASIDRTSHIPEVVQLVPKDYAGDDDAIRDLVFHILVEKGFL